MNSKESGWRQPHSKTLRNFEDPWGARQRLGVRLSPAAFLALILVCTFCAATEFAQAGPVEQAAQLETKGNFKDAAATLSQGLQTSKLAPEQRKQLEFELDRLERIKKDFPYTQDALFAELKKSVKDLSEKEYETWVKEGRFDSREINGQRFFMTSSVRNLFFRYPELNPRRVRPANTVQLQKDRLESCETIRKVALAAKNPYVLPKRFHVSMTVSAKPGAAPPGGNIRAWLPVPRHTPFQDAFELISTSPTVKHLDSDESPIRSLYMEQAAKGEAPTIFKLEYDYTTHAVSFDLDPNKVTPCDINDPELRRFTREGPHVVFSPEMRALARQITGDETNPYRKTKKTFDWIAEHIHYSFAIEYSTIRNLSEYCRVKGYGDCGQEAMLFIALCRLEGVPARWQTGWNTFPGDEDIHDWSEIYLAPYGWVPVDPYMGIFAMRYATALAPDQRRAIRNFYFGGLDQYRMIANSDHTQTLNPPKQSMRSDNVDFQRGELEWGDHNIYFDKYSYEFTVKELKVSRSNQ
jgi:transglutaminase-like putative cysteine protease